MNEMNDPKMGDGKRGGDGTADLAERVAIVREVIEAGGTVATAGGAITPGMTDEEIGAAIVAHDRANAGGA